MIAPAPREPAADRVLARWLEWVGDDGTRLLPNLRRMAAIDRRREEQAAPAVRDAMTVLGEACGLKLRIVGEVEDPPLPRPRAKRAPRTPRPPK